VLSIALVAAYPYPQGPGKVRILNILFNKSTFKASLINKVAIKFLTAPDCSSNSILRGLML